MLTCCPLALSYAVRHVFLGIWELAMIRRLVLNLLVLSGLPTVSHGSALNSSATIGYQVHSWNDLREWRAGFRKGMEWMKVDPNFQNPAFCATQSRVPRNDSRGCMILNHDDPVTTRTDYNSTEDILAYIADPANLAFFQDRFVRIALCFKNADTPCDGSRASAGWLSLIDDFFAAANKLIATLALRLEFILDGDGTKAVGRDCLQDRWRPWNWTFISNSNDPRAMFSDNVSEGFDRFQILNEPVDDNDPGFYMRLDAAVDYGKFSKQSRYPYLNWEPCDQDPILQVCDVYLDKGLEQEAGFKFAINIDPIQLEVYAAPASGTAWNVPLPGSDTFAAPFVAALPFGGGVTLLSVYTNNKTAMLEYTVYQAPALFGSLTQISEQPLPPTPLVDLVSLSAPAPAGTPSTKQFVLLADSHANYAVGAVSATEPAITVVANGTLAPNGSFTAFFGAALQRVAGANYAATVFTAGNCLNVQLVALDSSFGVHSSGLFAVECLDSLGGVTSASVELLSGSGSAACDLVAAVAYSRSTTIFAASVCFNLTGSAPSVIGPAPLAVGNSPRLSGLVANGSAYLIELHSDGFCWNTEINNKRADVALCDSTPVSTPNVLTYTFGSLDDWLQLLTGKAPVTACDEQLLHGMFDMGSAADVLLYASGNATALAAVSLHVGLPAPVNDTAQCGQPRPYEGLVLDGWALPLL